MSKIKNCWKKYSIHLQECFPIWGSYHTYRDWRNLNCWHLKKGEFVLTLLKFTKSLTKLNRLSTVSFDTFFEFSTNITTRGHSLKLAKRRVTTDLRLHFFSEQVINIWNSLDEKTVKSSSLNVFKGILNDWDKHQRWVFWWSLVQWDFRWEKTSGLELRFRLYGLGLLCIYCSYCVFFFFFSFH